MARLFAFLSSRPVSHLRLPGSFSLRCGEVLLFCRLVSVFITPSGGNGRGEDRVANEMSAGRGDSKRPSVMQTNGSGSLAIHATPRRARVRFEAAVTLLSPKSASPANLHSRLYHQYREQCQRATYRSHIHRPSQHHKLPDA